MQQNGQDKNPAAWYYLGRIYLQQGKLAPADTALTQAEQLAPDCAKDIAGYRRNAWVALVKAGSKFEEDKNVDSALALYRQAGSIYRGSPIPYYQTAAILNDKGQADSAAYYFGQAAAVRGEPDRHDRASSTATARRSTRARCCSTRRSTTRRPWCSSSTSSGCPTTTRPSAGWRRRTAG